MKRCLVALFLFAAACGTPSRYDACTRVNASPRFTGYTVYSCPHPFLTMGEQDRGYTADARTGTGYGYGARYARAITDWSTREVLYWDRFPEALDHEALHVNHQIRDDR